jgi:hypothetical protein
MYSHVQLSYANKKQPLQNKKNMNVDFNVYIQIFKAQEEFHYLENYLMTLFLIYAKQILLQIRELILDGSLHLIQEGLKSGFLYPLIKKQDKCSKPIPLPPDTCSLSGLCEMAKHLPSLNEMELQTLQLMGDDVSVTEQDLFSRVVENNCSFSKMITLMGQQYLLPPKSSFLLSDISCMQPLLNCK